MLTRQQMVDTINGGGSVLHNGRLITRVENLPSAANLAKTPAEKKAASKALDDDIARLQQQKAELGPKNTGKASTEGGKEPGKGAGEGGGSSAEGGQTGAPEGGQTGTPEGGQSGPK